ncbi:MAG: TIGR01777 family protein [Acidobacteria bacterium]|nr:MAG: TIGR01777 family protein [Acidobacteriota bacterium]
MTAGRGTVAVSGASGLLGSALVPELERRGHRVLRLVRREPRPGADELAWSPERGLLEPHRIAGVDAIVHLAGENIAAGRWTEARKRAIRDSRVRGTRALVRSLSGVEPAPRVFACASAVGWYGPRGDEPLDESAPSGSGFLAGVVRDWEAAAGEAAGLGMRVVALRYGAVLDPRGGMLGRLLPLFRLGLGGPVGSGRQVISWVLSLDAARATVWAVDHDDASGPYNVTAPAAVTQREFARTLGRVLGRPAVLPTPAVVLRLAFGELADELLLGGQRVVPRRLLEAGFTFVEPELEGALRRALSRPAA